MAHVVEKQNMLELQHKSFDIKFDLQDTSYRPIENIGTGAYGVVCSAEHFTGEKVAIKKIPAIFEQPTIAKRTYREIKILKHFKHDNIIAIREILKPKGHTDNLKDIYIVLDLMETDLHRIIHSNQELTDEHIRYFLYQILRGLKYIHSANIIHRDLKPSNLLVNENCDLKIGDFGMARAVSSLDNDYNAIMTQYVATRWYRAPELLMARLAYTGAVDMWSVGCIFAEMFGRKQIFPGRDFIHQLKLIFGILGTPSRDFLKIAQSDIIKKHVQSWGEKQPVALKQLYPKAPAKAIDLMDKMFYLNPQKRITVQMALKHPFLSKYHDPNDEPICVPAFDFDFEGKVTSALEVKNAIIQEVMEYHKVEEKPKIEFNFRPVPRNEISNKIKKKTSTNNGFDKIDKSMESANSANNFGLNAFLKQVQKSNPSQHSQSGLQAFLEASKISAVNSSDAIPSFISTNSPENIQQVEDNEHNFKVPHLPELEKMKTLQVKSQKDDIEMLSAKSVASDVVMLSANKLEAEVQVADESKKECSDADKTINTKEVLKAAILNAALRKQKGETEVKPKPMTAHQRQKEREEKKKKKMEKALERKKKQKNKDKKDGINLSEEDRNLLQRWACMQKSTGVPNQSDQSDVKANEDSARPFVQQIGALQITSNQQCTNDPVMQNPQFSVPPHQTVPSLQPLHTQVHTANSKAVPAMYVNQPSYSALTTDNNTPVIKDQVLSNMCASTALQHNTPFTLHQNENYSLHTSDLLQEKNITSSLPIQPSVTDISDVNAHYQTYVNEINTSKVNINNPEFQELSMNGPDNSSNYTPLSKHLEALFDVLSSQAPVSTPADSKQPPTYNEAIQNTICGVKSAEVSTLPFLTTNVTAEDNQSSQLPFNSYEINNPTSTANTFMSDTAAEESNSLSERGNGSVKEGNMLSVITQKMMKSHVDDLTLTKTPRGTGGGYGVGLDMEVIMADASRQYTPNQGSAPLSATESLIGDWLEVSGMKGLDAKDYEALQRELELGSPINLSDIVTSSS